VTRSRGIVTSVTTDTTDTTDLTSFSCVSQVIQTLSPKTVTTEASWLISLFSRQAPPRLARITVFRDFDLEARTCGAYRALGVPGRMCRFLDLGGFRHAAIHPVGCADRMPRIFYPNTRVGHTHAHEGHQLVRGREVAAASISQPVTR
jgi:hypothetical protein